MKQLNRNTTSSPAPYPEKVLQFGGGNFLRAFVDWMLDEYNEKTASELGVLLVTPIARDNYANWQAQDGLYHVLTRGFQNGKVVDEKHLVKSISRILHLYPKWEAFLASAENPDMRFVISNTTEAGIRFSKEDKKTDTPPNEFPAKLTLWLHHRYQHFQGAPDKGCIFIPVELIMKNGENLRKCILQNTDNWGLDSGFKSWISDHNIFCNTLVDRIVPGISRENLSEEMKSIGFEDSMMTQGEPFHFWVIEGPEQVRKELPLDKAGLNVIFTDDQTPYRTRKVRILNGAHTSMVPVGHLYGIDTVKEAVEHEVMGKFVHQVIFDEIVPTLDLPEAELKQYANDVLERFRNPFIKHQLLSIALNSISKFKTRVLPSILKYHKEKNALPKRLVFSFAALIRFYKGSWQGKSIPLNDDAASMAFSDDQWKNWDGSEAGIQTLVQQVLSQEKFWGQDLNKIPELRETIANHLWKMEKEGKVAIEEL